MIKTQKEIIYKNNIIAIISKNNNIKSIGIHNPNKLWVDCESEIEFLKYVKDNIKLYTKDIKGKIEQRIKELKGEK